MQRYCFVFDYFYDTDSINIIPIIIFLNPNSADNSKLIKASTEKAHLTLYVKIMRTLNYSK